MTKKGYILMESGDKIEFELYPNEAPNTVANFEQLANSGFYDGVIFHRVIPGFVSQGGDPTGTGAGGSGKALPCGNRPPGSGGAGMSGRRQLRRLRLSRL